MVGAYSIKEMSPKSNFVNLVSILQHLNLKEKSMKVIKDLEKALKAKTKNFMDIHEIHTVLINLINRKRFNYTIKDILHFIIRCLCFRKIKYRKFTGTKEDWQENIKKHY